MHLISPRFPPGYKGYDKKIKMHPLVRLFPRIWKVSGYLSGILWLFQVRRLVRRIRPDILDAHFITLNGYLAVISGFHPLILSAWGSDVLISPQRNPIHRFLTEYALKKAEIVVCDSETVRKELIKLGTNPSRIRKIFWGVDTQKFAPQQRDNEIKRRLALVGAPVVICTRHLEPLYNVQMVIKAIPLVLKQVPKVKFIIVGGGEQRNYLEDLANSSGVLDSTRFIGWIEHDELPNYLALSDVYVSTSLSDSTSLSLQEAMACELAPVVTDLPANREWIVDGKNGLIVSTNDVHVLAAKITHLLENEQVRERFGKAGREIIKEKAEYEKEMDRMERIYQELLGE